MDFETATYRKVTRHLIPFLFACYVLAYIDRVNVGFAKLQMQQDLGISDTVYGIGAGLFFIGYFFFEVPANMMLQKLGARRWLGPIMIVWGLVSASTIFVQGGHSFYALRLLLGVVESGFFPGVILYLTFWFPRQRRARMVALFMSATPLAGVIAGPVSGGILAKMSGVAGLRAWQWLFLMEGLPSVLAGIVTLVYLVDGPRSCRWLTTAERDCVLERLAEEHRDKQKEGVSEHRLVDAFRSWKVWLLCVVYFGFQMGNYGLAFWLPQILKETLTRDPWKIGLLSAIPWSLAAIAMVIYARHSDQTGERRWHVAVGAGLAGVALAAGGISGVSGAVGLALVTCASIGIMSGRSIFWSLPTGLLSGAAAAAGIAWINSVGNLAGYVSPFLVGRIRDATGSMTLAHFVLGVPCLISALVVLLVAHRRASEQSAHNV